MQTLIPARQIKPVEDIIFALNKQATERKARGDITINATVGALLQDDGQLLVLPTVASTLAATPPAEFSAYAPIAGMPMYLKGVLADIFGEGGVTNPALYGAAVAVATPGGTGALRHAMMSYLEPGQSFLTPHFYWGPYKTIAEETGRAVATFRMFGDDGRLDVSALDVELGKMLAKQSRALVVLNDPCNNPTGYSMDDAEWSAVVEVVLRHAERAPVTLLVDMAYAAYGRHKTLLCLPHIEKLLGKAGLCFAWSGSKSFTEYGLRVGAIVACEPDAIARQVVEASFAFSSRGTWSNCNRGGMYAIGQILADAGLKSRVDAERQVARALLAARVDAFNSLAKGKLDYPEYQGGFFVTVFHPRAEEAAQSMQQDGVYVVPQKGALRVALCSVAVKDVPKLVESLIRVAAKQ